MIHDLDYIKLLLPYPIELELCENAAVTSLVFYALTQTLQTQIVENQIPRRRQIH